VVTTNEWWYGNFNRMSSEPPSPASTASGPRTRQQESMAALALALKREALPWVWKAGRYPPAPCQAGRGCSCAPPRCQTPGWAGRPSGHETWMADQATADRGPACRG